MKNYLDIAIEALNLEGAPYSEGQTRANHRFIELSYGSEGLRIYSQDTETDLAIAFTDMYGWVTSEVIRLTSASDHLVRAILSEAIAELMHREDYEPAKAAL